jgi:hypothetical protein
MVVGFFGCWPRKMIIYHHAKISERKNTIMPYIGIFGLWPNNGRRREIPDR